jgi:thiol-disulfide isomerase/thioredoxin
MMALRVGKDVFDYINDVKIERARHAMKKRMADYTPNPNSIDKLENIDQKFHLVIFSAEWCGDCVAYVPGLAKSLAIAKNDMLQARVVDYDNHRDMADEMNIRKIPTIIVYDKNWKEIGRFTESPQKYGTVEEELCAILDSATGTAKV